MSCVERMGLSDAQGAVLRDERPRVLVSAGAGSGKTRLLVAHFVRALVEDGVDAEQLIAVTFTRKAGAELASRIRSSLESCGRSDLARSLDAAAIGTIHSLCRRLIKDHALEAGVDPACVVLEADAALIVKEEVSREIWDLAIEQAGETELEILASRGQAFRKAVVPLYDRLRGIGFDRPRLLVSPGLAEEQVRAELVGILEEALAAGCAVGSLSVTLAADLERLRACLAWIMQANSVSDRGHDLHITDGFFPTRKTRAMEPHFELVRAALTRYRCALAEVSLTPLVSTMNRLLDAFHRSYEARKRDRGLLDFADLELRARALLEGRGREGEVTASSPESLVLVDEFQDTNELQCAVLEGLGAARMVMVGDERQSIYRFRGADVNVFRRREAELGGDKTQLVGGGVHRLDTNYRSRPGLLAFINRLFAQADFFGGSFVPLRPGCEDTRSGGAPLAPSTEVLLVERRQTADSESPELRIQEAEARVVATRIRRLVDEEDRRQRDIVVLVPTLTYVDLYHQAMTERGLEVYVVRGKGYYAQQEVADVMSVLRILVNPHDDVALLGVLRSPLVGISDDGLYLLGREGRSRRTESLWEVVRDACPEALAGEDRRLLDDFLRRFRELRLRVGRPGLAQLIDDAVSDFCYDVWLLAMPDGRRHFANVRKLMRVAGDFEALEGPNLAGFVRLVESMGDLGDREGSAPTLAEGEDVVRLMTVHQAKGLEFPVVVLAGLGSDVPRGTPSEFVVDSEGRMGVFLRGSQHKTYESHDLCLGPAWEIVERERSREREEDIRLLYVAMTRAQERLILVGARPRGGKPESCRIGRIITALGLRNLPGENMVVRLEALDAVVMGVAPRPLEETEASEGELHMAGDTGEEHADLLPQFLEVTTPCPVPQGVSFSALAAYQRCPRQYYLERLLGLDLEEGTTALREDTALGWEERLVDEEEERAGREVGLLVHGLLEQLPVRPDLPPAELLRALAEEWLLQAGLRLASADVERALTLTLAFWESPLAEMWTRPSTMREAPFLFLQGDTMVSGVMDLLWCGREMWRIVDYKTNALKGRSPSDLVRDYELQAVVYCLAALRAGAPEAQMEFLFLEQPREPVTIGFGREDAARLESTLDGALEGLRRASFPALKGEACNTCSVSGLCVSLSRP